MKKTYIQPAMLVEEDTILSQLICQSPNKEGYTVETSGNLSKDRRGIFQDDDDDEEQSIW